MKTDNNKNITAVTYNHLNLPTSLTINGGTINYVYDATGIKQSKTASNGSNTIYAGGFIYENNVLKQFSQPEGYVVYNSGIYNYIYQYKDHLGNIRLSYQDKDNTGAVNSSEIVQENNYYPFGLMHKGYNGGISGVDNKYKYNGKELQDELGLNMTAMDYRQYDNALGRFNSMDRLSELAYSISPYRFAYNNPVYWNDPTGLFESKEEAINWAREHGIRTGWFSSSKVQQGSDGTWAINNKKEGTSYYAVNETDAEAMGLNPGDVISSALVVGQSKKKESDRLDFTIWGLDRSGDTSGRKGSASHSIQSSELVTPGESFRLNTGTNSVLKFFQWVAGYFKNAQATTGHAIAIEEAVNKNGNTSTMETRSPEPIVKGSVEVATYHFHLNDSTVTKTTNMVNFTGTASEVKSRIDSTNNINQSRNSTKEAWLRSWGK